MPRDPEASEPFTEEELARVLAGCEADPSEWCFPSAVFLAYSGAHILVLSGGWRRETRDDGTVDQWYQEPLRGDAVRGRYIYWRRPKNDKQIGIERSVHLGEWLPLWLDKPRPKSPRRYEQVFERVGRAVGLQVNPLRFRHYCAVRMKRAGLSSMAVCRRLGVDLKTLEIYINNPRSEAAKLLADSSF